MSIKHILIIEDDVVFANLLQRYLTRYQHEVVLANSVQKGKDALKAVSNKFDVILLDYNLPDGTANDFMDFLIEQGIQVPVLVMTSFHDIKTAVNMMQKGAKDYITKPINQEELLMQINSIGTVIQETNSEKVADKKLVKKVVSESKFVEGHSDVSRELHRQVQLVANTDMSVLIIGESGTGKENIARTLHQSSARHSRPFVAIDCGAISNDLAGSELFGHVKGAFSGALMDKKGQFEIADGGTIFLDEIGNLSYENQVKLLRVIQEQEILRVGDTKPKKIDVRIITATNENLTVAMENGHFREDLYFRINEFTIQVPSLKNRIEDLDLFIDFFIQKANQQLNKNVIGIDANVKEIFEKYSWPGNLRELQNVIKRGVLLSQSSNIALADLPADMQQVKETALQGQIAVNQSADLKSVNEQIEKEMIIKALVENKYNKSKTAKQLKIDRTTLYNKLSKYKIDID